MKAIRTIRTPEERFEDLEDFEFQPHYLQLNQTRIHYIDEGTGEIILCLHGEPSWVYLYRKIIDILLEEGYRVVAPDFIGFGRSDKFTEISDYTFSMFYDMLTKFIDALHLTPITLVSQDWGGLIGLTYAANNNGLFSRLVIMNTFLPTGEEKLSEGFHNWRNFAEHTKDIDVGRAIQNGTVSRLNSKVLKGYNAPFPDIRYKAGVSAWPLIVPLSPTDDGAPQMKKAREILSRWEKPAITMFSDMDPIMKGGDRFFRKLIPGTKDQPQITIKNAGHFLQEDKGEEIGQKIYEFMARTEE